MKNLIYPALLFLFLFSSCNVKEIDQQLTICGTGNTKPTLEDFFKCGDYQTVEITEKAIFKNKSDDVDHPDRTANYELITLQKGNLMYGVLISPESRYVFTAEKHHFGFMETSKNKDIAASSKIGSFTFFQKGVEDYSLSSQPCINKGILTMKYDFDSSMVGGLISCEIDLSICLNSKVYQVLHDSWPHDE